MQALVVDRGGALSMRELPLPGYGPCQALVRMKSCGVCGTDMKIIHGTLKDFDSYPAVLGHEGVGEVVALGDKVTSLALGDKVVLPFLDGPLNGVHSGFGALAEYAVVGDAEAYRRHGIATPGYSLACDGQTKLSPSDKLDDVGAAMIVTFREVLSAMRRFGCRANASVVVFGMGPVGLCFTKYAKLLGMKPVVAVANTEAKAAFAKAQGADFVVNSKTENVEAAIRAICPDGVDFVIDAAGSNEILNRALGLVADHGKICAYGLSAETSMRLDWTKTPYNWTLDFVQWPVKSEEAAVHSQVLSFINLGVLNPYDYISHVMDFASAPEAFRMMEQRLPDRKKIVIRF